MEPCINSHRIDRIESDVQELQKADRKQAEEITSLKEGQAESRVMQRMILEQLAEIKMVLSNKSKSASPNKEWLDMIKWVIGATIVAIVTWMIKGNM